MGPLDDELHDATSRYARFFFQAEPVLYTVVVH
jgi:hypothetical protein